MTTSSTTIFNNLVTLTGTALSAYTRIPNPYALNENTGLYLKKGYGVAFGPGTRQDFHVGCKIGYQRIFNIVLTNLMAATEHDTTTRSGIEKALLEDFISLRIALEQDPTLSQSCIKTEYGTDSGILYGATEEVKFITINIDLLCLYEEALN